MVDRSRKRQCAGREGPLMGLVATFTRALVAGACLLSPASGLHAQGKPASPVLEKIRATGTIFLGYREGSLPFSYLDAQGRAIGFSLDLCRHITDAIAARLNLADLAVVQVPTTPSSRQIMLEAETIDLDCGPVTNTEQKQRGVAFSVTTFVAAVQALVRKDSGIRSLKDMPDRMVVTTAGTTSDVHLRSAAGRQGLSLKYRLGRDHADSLRLLLRGDADVMVLDDALLRGLLLSLPEAERQQLVVLGDSYGFEPYAIVFRRHDPEFKKLVDDSMIGMMQSGEFARIYDKWFTSPIPPAGGNLDLPMSGPLKQLMLTPNDKGV